MVRAEVVFSGDDIIVNGYLVEKHRSAEYYHAKKNGNVAHWDYSQEKVIKFCLEN